MRSSTALSLADYLIIWCKSASTTDNHSTHERLALLGPFCLTFDSTLKAITKLRRSCQRFKMLGHNLVPGYSE